MYQLPGKTQRLIPGIDDCRGFSLIEALIAIAILSIGLMALTATIWSSSQSARKTKYSDSAILGGQEWVEMLSVLPIDHDSLDPGQHLNYSPISDDSAKVEWEVINATDVDSDGTPDFKTIAISVYSRDKFSEGELKMRSYYRRKIND